MGPRRGRVQRKGRRLRHTSIAIAAEIPYLQVYDVTNTLAERERPRGKRGRRSSARTGVKKATYRRYLESLGWVCHPTMQIGSGCTVHLCEDELPRGRLIAAVICGIRRISGAFMRLYHEWMGQPDAALYSVSRSPRSTLS
jgi:hypothetical protein